MLGSFFAVVRQQHETWRATTCGIMILCLWLLAQGSQAQRGTTSHTIPLTAIEFKLAATTDQLEPPPTNPVELSKGYRFKGSGEADKNVPKRWEVSSCLFTPGFITVQQGDTVTLNAFMVNGDHHGVFVMAPDGQAAVPTTTWHRGRQYQVSFLAERAGTYRLICSTHAPTMTATILMVPRECSARVRLDHAARLVRNRRTTCRFHFGATDAAPCIMQINRALETEAGPKDWLWHGYREEKPASKACRSCMTTVMAQVVHDHRRKQNIPVFGAFMRHCRNRCGSRHGRLFVGQK